MHSDLRPDNMLITPQGTARLVDWNWVARGPAWCDFVGLLPMMAEHGLDVDRMMAGSPLLEGVDGEALDAFLAIIVGYMVDSCVQPTSRPLAHAHPRPPARPMALTSIAERCPSRFATRLVVTRPGVARVPLSIRRFPGLQPAPAEEPRQ